MVASASSKMRLRASYAAPTYVLLYSARYSSNVYWYSRVRSSCQVVFFCAGGAKARSDAESRRSLQAHGRMARYGGRGAWGWRTLKRSNFSVSVKGSVVTYY